MCLYLFNKAHTSTTTSDLKNSKNIMVKLDCYINVTKHPGAKSMETVQLSVKTVKTMYKFGQQLFIKNSILMYELISFQ